MFIFWTILCTISLVFGTIITCILLTNCKSNTPALITFGITLLLVFIGIIGVFATMPEEQTKEYEHCSYCGEEVEWREIK